MKYVIEVLLFWALVKYLDFPPIVSTIATVALPFFVIWFVRDLWRQGAAAKAKRATI